MFCQHLISVIFQEKCSDSLTVSFAQGNVLSLNNVILTLIEKCVRKTYRKDKKFKQIFVMPLSILPKDTPFLNLINFLSPLLDHILTKHSVYRSHTSLTIMDRTKKGIQNLVTSNAGKVSSNLLKPIVPPSTRTCVHVCQLTLELLIARSSRITEWTESVFL